MSAQIEPFRERVWTYYRDHPRDLPWRHDPMPYQVFVSELMLQQTQVARVATKYPLFLERFPSFEALAVASLTELLGVWQGMGYNRRALFMQRSAREIVARFGGELPRDPAVLLTLPGVGPGTAGSLAAFAYNEPVVFIETNIRRVFIHEFFSDGLPCHAELVSVSASVSQTLKRVQGDTKAGPAGPAADQIPDRELMPLIEATLDREHPREWYYALMDYGAYVAKQVPNPNRRSRHHTVQAKFEGSLRQLRGEILRRLMTGADLPMSDPRLHQALTALQQEGFIERAGETYRLAK